MIEIYHSDHITEIIGIMPTKIISPIIIITGMEILTGELMGISLDILEITKEALGTKLSVLEVMAIIGITAIIEILWIKILDPYINYASNVDPITVLRPLLFARLGEKRALHVRAKTISHLAVRKILDINRTELRTT